MKYKVENGFATTGCKDAVGDYEIPFEWWSRKYEYPWVAAQMCKGDVVLDAGCGISHFFKYWLSDNCKQVVALDGDKRILDMEDRDNLKFVFSGIEHMPLDDDTFDKVICVSVLEHTGDTMHLILDEFARVLKPTGRLVVTLDIPTIELTTWQEAVEQSRFEIDEKGKNSLSWDEPEDILIEPRVMTNAAGARVRVSSKSRKVFCCSLLLKD